MMVPKRLTELPRKFWNGKTSPAPVPVRPAHVEHRPEDLEEHGVGKVVGSSRIQARNTNHELS